MGFPPRTSSSSTAAQAPGARTASDTSTSVVLSGGQWARSGVTVRWGLGAACGWMGAVVFVL